MGKDLGCLPPRVAAAMAEREEKRKLSVYGESRKNNLPDYIKMACSFGGITFLGNGRIADIAARGRRKNA